MWWWCGIRAQIIASEKKKHLSSVNKKGFDGDFPLFTVINVYDVRQWQQEHDEALNSLKFSASGRAAAWIDW